MISYIVNRRTKHIRFVLRHITSLNNEINQISFKMIQSEKGSFREEYFVQKMRIKAILLKKYNRRLRTLSI